MANVFISYAREDREFVSGLQTALAGRGYDVWVDWQDIPPSADYFEEIQRAIGGADAVLVVLSPDFASSRVCGQEVAHALAASKRLIPVHHRTTPSATLPDAIRRLNWIAYKDDDDQNSAFSSLVAAIETDLDWVVEHTALSVRAGEWEARNFDGNLLLRGQPLREAEEWLAGDDAAKDPQPTALQRSYLLASRRGATARQRRLIAVSAIVTVVAIGLAIMAFLQRQDAIDQRTIAVAQKQEADAQRAEADRQRENAEQQAATARSRALAANSEAALDADPELSIRLAVEALAVDHTSEAESALREALGASHVRNVFSEDENRVIAVRFDPSGDVVYSGSLDGIVRAQSLSKNKEQWAAPPLGAPVVSIALSPDASLIAGAGANGSVTIWSTDDGHQVAELSGHSGIVWNIVWSSDGSKLASSSDDGTVQSLGHRVAFRGHVIGWPPRRARRPWPMPRTEARSRPERATASPWSGRRRIGRSNRPWCRPRISTSLL